MLGDAFSDMFGTQDPISSLDTGAMGTGSITMPVAQTTGPTSTSSSVMSIIINALNGMFVGSSPKLPSAPVAPTPWYKSTGGMIGIGLGALALGVGAYYWAKD